MAAARSIARWLVLLTAAVGTLATIGCVGPGSPAVTAWVISADLAARPDLEPQLETEIFSAARRRLHLVAAVNETISFQVGLRASSWPSAAVDVRLEALRGAGADEIPAKAIEILRQRAVTITEFDSWYPAHTQHATTPLEVFDHLVPWDAPRGGGPIRPSRDASEFAWVDIHVPPTTPPGSYRGRLTVASGGGAATLVADVFMEVVPVALPSEPTLTIVAPVDPRGVLREQLGWSLDSAAATRILASEPTHQSAVAVVDAIMDMLHRHRLNPILQAGFPKFRASGPSTVEIDWTDYDALVSRWIDGSAYGDRVRSAVWLLPVSHEYPELNRNGGLRSAEYARILGAYLRECERHFRELGWADRAISRILPPDRLTAEFVDGNRRLNEIFRAAEIQTPLVVHLPATSLASLGWRGAPAIEINSPGVWAPPAAWFEPRAMSQQRSLGQRVFFVPGAPPFSPSLSPAAPAADALSLAWQAYRYECDGIWIEHALPALNRPPDRADSDSLLASGKPYGLPIVATTRLKRLQRSQQDYELLRLLQQTGKPFLAERTAQQVVRWGFTDACLENILAVRPAGWSIDGTLNGVARGLMRQEMLHEFAAGEPTDRVRADLAGRWGRIMRDAARIEPAARGVRLESHDDRLRTSVFATLTNTTDQPVAGRWILRELPPGWSTEESPAIRVSPNAAVRRELELDVTGLSYNADGALAIPLEFDTGAGDPHRTFARLAVTSCPQVGDAPRIDGDLSDWIISVNNTAGDFRLVRGRGADGSDLPGLPTRAYFCWDREMLYVGVSCALSAGEQPSWSSDNRIQVDGAIPWGEDLVEVLLHPADTPAGTGADLYTLQIKPSGLLVARHGAATYPPVNESVPWRTDARVAVKVGRRAWTVELAIPLDSLGESAARNRLWGVNITRLDSRRGDYSSWSGAKGHCYLPELLGNLILTKP
jgi:hypothetical protein